MTVENQQIRVSYVGDGTSVAFAIPYPFYLSTDITVLLGNAVQSSGYAISGGVDTNGNPNPGTLTFSTPPAAQVAVQALLNVPLTQLVNLVDGTAFPSSTLNQMNDRAIQAILRLADRFGRSVLAPDGDVSPVMALPAAGVRANTFLGFDANGNVSLGQTLPSGTLSQSTIGGFLWPLLAAEQAAGVTPVNYAYPAGHVYRYGTNASPGVTDMTSAFQAAISQHAQGGPGIYAPAGTHLVGALTLPITQFGFTFYGDGPGRTILVAKSGNITLISKNPTLGALEGATFRDFAIQASVGGSTSTAFSCSGFRTSTFRNIRGINNASNTGFASLFLMSSSPGPCYGNLFDCCGLDQTHGWAKGWDFQNNGTGTGGNANANTIINPWFYSNVGMTCCIDAQFSAMTTIIGGDFEQNAPAVAINSGNTTLIQGCWFEVNGNSSLVADITYNFDAVNGVANSGVVIGCSFSGAHTINFNKTGQCSANIWIGNNEVGNQTFANNDGTNLRLQGTGTAPSAPTLSNTGGTSGTLTIVGTAAQLTEPNLSNMIAYLLEYTWTPSASGAQSQFTLSIPAGYELAFLSVGSTLNASGLPYPTAVSGNGVFWASNVSTGAVTLAIYVMIKHIDT